MTVSTNFHLKSFAFRRDLIPYFLELKLLKYKYFSMSQVIVYILCYKIILYDIAICDSHEIIQLVSDSN